MKQRIWILLFLVTAFYAYGQHAQYISVQSGLHFDSYNSLGARIYTEFQRNLNARTSYGIFVEHTRYLSRYMTDYYPGIYSDWHIVGYQRHFHVKLWKNILFWQLGVGGGLSHLSWTNNGHYDEFGINLTFHATLNIKLGKNVYLETTPVPILVPFSRFYIHYMPRLNNLRPVYSGTFHAVGLKIKI